MSLDSCGIEKAPQLVNVNELYTTCTMPIYTSRVIYKYVHTSFSLSYDIDMQIEEERIKNDSP